MIACPEKAKGPFKTALAMVIAYSIALSMDWDRAYWAAFAVCMVSMTTIGQSMTKAALRMAGTLMAMAVALTLIALFIQDRWLFFICLSLYGCVCTYIMSGSKHAYFWHVGWFVCAIICMDSDPNSASVFQTAILRCQETGLGILVYTLIMMFVWPVSSLASFTSAAAKFASSQHLLVRACLGCMVGKQSADTVQTLSMQTVKAKTGFDQLLSATAIDSAVVRDRRDQWSCYQRQAAELTQAIIRCSTMSDLQALDMRHIVPGLEDFGNEIDLRLTEIDTMLNGAPPAHSPRKSDVSFDKNALRELSHFQRASCVAARACLLKVDTLTRSLFETIKTIHGYGKEVDPPDACRQPSSGFVPDPDRLVGVIRFMTIMWIAYLAWVFVNGFPGGRGFLGLAAPFSAMFANAPQFPMSKLYAPVAVSTLFAGVLYIFIMPGMSGFAELGLLIFSATFAICYIFSEPQQTLGKVFGLTLLFNIASIDNQQTYSFFTVSTTALMYVFLILVLSISSYFPFYLRAEHVFLRMLKRFFRSSEYLMSTMHINTTPTRLDRWKTQFHAREVATLPAKLGSWAPHIKTTPLSGTVSKQGLPELVNCLQSLSNQLQQRLKDSEIPQSQILKDQLLDDFKLWDNRIQAFFHQLSTTPTPVEHEAVRTGLDRRMHRIEERIQFVLDTAPANQFSDHDAENFYSLLCSYRSVSESFVEYSGSAGSINWDCWCEERF
jgi:uncharacterized membrane protein YccC